MVKKQKDDIEEAPQKDTTPANEKGTVSVLSSRGLFLRAYSKELHGADYKGLAKEYAMKIGGTVK